MMMGGERSIDRSSHRITEVKWKTEWKTGDLFPCTARSADELSGLKLGIPTSPRYRYARRSANWSRCRPLPVLSALVKWDAVGVAGWMRGMDGLIPSVSQRIFEARSSFCRMQVPFTNFFNSSYIDLGEFYLVLISLDPSKIKPPSPPLFRTLHISPSCLPSSVADQCITLHAEYPISCTSYLWRLNYI